MEAHALRSGSAQLQAPDFFQNALKLGLWGKAHGSISVQEGQPRTSPTFPRIFSFRSCRNSPENSVP
jgi:hypothetical protein